MKPIWRKLMEVEPGLYWVGGNCDQPSSAPYVQCYKGGVFCVPSWFARIGDVPELPVMERKYREPVLPQDWGKWCEFSDDGDKWLQDRLMGYGANLTSKCFPWVSTGSTYNFARIEVTE